MRPIVRGPRKDDAFAPRFDEQEVALTELNARLAHGLGLLVLLGGGAMAIGLILIKLVYP